MGTVFQSITAELSKEFENLLLDKYAKDFLERVCDLTGTLMVCNSNNPMVAPDSLKICGTWASVSQAHNILSAYTVLKELITSDSDEPTDIDALMNEYSNSHKRKRKSYNNSEDISSNTSVIRQPGKQKSPAKTVYGEKDFNASPVPVLLSSVGSAAPPVPIMYQNNENLMKNKCKTSNSEFTDYESNMYLMENTDSSSDSQAKDKQGNVEDGTKDAFHCAMCRYKTNTAKNLEAHLERFHFKPVTCHICGRGFGFERDLKRHLLKNKYSCGSRRSVINKNYVNIQKTDAEGDEQSRGVNDSAELSNNATDIGDILNLSEARYKEDESFSKANIQEENQLHPNSTVTIKKEPVYFDEEDLDESSNPPSSSFQSPPNSFVEMNSEDPTKQPAILEVRSARNFDSSESLHSEHGEHEDSFNLSLNFVYEPNEHEQQKPNDRDFSDAGAEYRMVENDFEVIETGDKANFACKHCLYTAHKKQHMVDHVCRMHKKQFSCDHCHSLFGLMKDLNRHLRRTHGVEVPFKKARSLTGTVIQ